MVSFCLVTFMSSAEVPALRKIKDVTIYKDTSWFCAFPSVIRNGRNDIMVAFRRAPERRLFGEKSTWHCDANSYMVAVHSKDGENWTREPELIYAHPQGGSQDPCLLKLKDGTILCASYLWADLRADGIKNLKTPNMVVGGSYVFCGGYLLRSTDKGKTWCEPIIPPVLGEEDLYDAFGRKNPPFNRGALYETENGRILWAVVANERAPSTRTSIHLLVSDDKGLTWKEEGVIASDDKVDFNETSMYETPSGDLIAFIRTAKYGDQACIARSKDGGKTFKWESMGFRGHPCHALRLPDNRVLLTYGYRHNPRSIKARVLNPECTDFAVAEEYVLYDGRTNNGDIGYTWSVMLDKTRALVVYYYNIDNGTRFIGGTIVEIN